MSKWITIQYTKNGSTFASADESRLQLYVDLQNVDDTIGVAQSIALGAANGSIIPTVTLLANGSGHQTNLVFTDSILAARTPMRLFIKDPDAYLANTEAFEGFDTLNGQDVANGFDTSGWKLTVVNKNY